MVTSNQQGDDDRLARTTVALRNEPIADGPSAEALARTILAVSEPSANTTVTWKDSYTAVSRRRGLTAAGAIAAAVLLGLFLIGYPRPKLALGQVIEKIRTARKMSFRVDEYGGEPRRLTGSSLTQVSEPDKLRTEWHEPQGDVVSIRNGKRLLLLNAAKKAAVVSEVPPGGIQSSAAALDQLKSLVEKDARTLGEKELDGVQVQGFEAVIKGRKFTLWANVKSGDPVRIVSEPLKDSPAAILPIQVLSDFKFGETFSDELFSLNVPADYDVRQERHEPVRPVEMVAAYLKAYAARHAGEFPVELKTDAAELAATVGLPEDRRKFSEAERELADAVNLVAMLLKTAKAGQQYQYYPGGKLGQQERMVFWCVDPLVTGTFVPLVPSPNQEVQPQRFEALDRKVLFGDLHTKQMTKDQMPPEPSE
jgi:outer membrane lipoprotein-sorting protein